jgi:hypothetical protein
MSGLLKCFILFLCVKLLMWLNILLNPLVLRWILLCCISSCLGSSSSDYIDVSPTIPGFCRNPVDSMVVLFPFFLDLSQECWKVFSVMVCCTKVLGMCYILCTSSSVVVCVFRHMVSLLMVFYFRLRN